MDEGEKVLAVKTTLTLPRRKRDPTHDRFLDEEETPELLSSHATAKSLAVSRSDPYGSSCELLEVYSPPSRTPIIATTGQHLIDRLASTGAFSKKDWGKTGWRVVIGTEGDLRRKCEVEVVYICVAPPPNRQERLLSAMFSARLPSCPEGTRESR
ncbi:hypothetical protein PAMP_012158 [Pampus punctatissimus]